MAEPKRGRKKNSGESSGSNTGMEENDHASEQQHAMVATPDQNSGFPVESVYAISDGNPAPDINAPIAEPQPELLHDAPGPDTVEDPVEILVGMAERGEIDPWNIDIIEVTDKFLSELDRRRQLNLQISGRTLFFAATLLRMKSEQLDIAEDDGGGDGEGEDLFGDEFGQALDSEIEYSGRLGPIERLEHEIQRRLDRKNLRKSPITLFELISELKNIEREERRRRRMSSPSDDSFLIEADDVVSIAHEEGYEGSALTILTECFEHVVEGELTLAELCKELEWGISDVYIPLLFLALDGRCSIRQEEFYGDIWVRINRTDGISLESQQEST